RMEGFQSKRTSDGERELSAKKPSIFRGLILAMLSGVFYSLVSVIVKKLNHLDPSQIALYRFVAIFVTVLPQTVPVGQNPLGPKKFRFYLILRGIFGGTNIFFNFLAIRYLSLSEAISIIFSSPVFVTVAARIFLKEPCSVSQCFAVVLTVTGIIFTTKLPSHLTEEHVVYTKEKLYGLMAAIGSVLCSSFAIPLTRKVKSVHQAILTFNYGLVTITETLFLTAVFGNFRWHHCGIEAAYIVLLGLFSFVGQTLMVLALQCELAGPVCTVKAASDIGLAFLWQILIFHEDPDSYCIIDSALVGFSVVFIGFNKWRSSRSNTSDLKNAEGHS
ncbi:Solute carrier family 35 member G1, partial [Araneus ventricosus]